MKRTKTVYNILLCIIIAFGCRQKIIPKPAGYMRIDFPEKKYTLFDTSCPFRFEIPVYCRIEKDENKDAEMCWFNITFPSLNGKIHISYKPVRRNLPALLEDSRTLAYKHTIKADAIREITVGDKKKKVFGILYEIQGNAASSVQFILTDSIRNFVRGSLYFNAHPNSDSLMPVIKFCRADIDRLIETFEWKY